MTEVRNLLCKSAVRKSEGSQVRGPQVRSPQVREPANPRTANPRPNETHVLVSAACFDVPARPWSFSLLCCCRLAHRFVRSRSRRPSRRPVRRPPLRPPTRADILRGEYGRYRANNDLLSYRLDIRVDPEKKFISGTNTIRFRMLKDDTRIQLDLYDNLSIDAIMFGDDGAELRARAEHRLRRLSRRRSRPAASTPSTSTIRARRANRAGSAASRSARIPPASRWINTACEGEGSSIWWPSKDQWRDELEEHGDARRGPERPGRRLERQVHGQDRSRRRLHALGLARAVPDQQLQRLAQYRQLRAFRRPARRPAARLLRPPGQPRQGQGAVRPGQADDGGVQAVLRRVSLHQGRLQAD